jgi:hypothetical protein
MTGRQNSLLAAIALLVEVSLSAQRPHRRLLKRHDAATGRAWNRTDPAYSDAMTLARVLADEDGSASCCIGPSTMNGLFEGEVGAAIYKTSRGVFEALFLPQSQAFDELQIRERRDGASLFVLVRRTAEEQYGRPMDSLTSLPFPQEPESLDRVAR